MPLFKISEFVTSELRKQFISDRKLIYDGDTTKVLSDLLSFPKGEELNKQIDSYVDSTSGVLKIIQFAINYHNPDITVGKMSEFINLLLKNENDVLQNVYTAIFGEYAKKNSTSI